MQQLTFFDDNFARCRFLTSFKRRVVDFVWAALTVGRSVLLLDHLSTVTELFGQSVNLPTIAAAVSSMMS